MPKVANVDGVDVLLAVDAAEEIVPNARSLAESIEQGRYDNKGMSPLQTLEAISTLTSAGQALIELSRVLFMRYRMDTQSVA